MATAKDMANIIRSMSSLLVETDVVESDACNVLNTAASKLDSHRQSKDWYYEIAKSRPIVFKLSKSKKLGLVKVALSGEIRFSGSKENHEAAGFEKLNICFECLDDKSNLQARWHVDLANISDMQEESQEGPVFHIQFGGNSATNEDRSLDFKLDRPRWMYPPIDFILACEIVVANFFPTNGESYVKM